MPDEIRHPEIIKLVPGLRRKDDGRLNVCSRKYYYETVNHAAKGYFMVSKQVTGMLCFSFNHPEE